MPDSPRVTLTIAACSLALFAALAFPLVTGQVFWFDDLPTFHLPLRLVYQNALRAGDSLLWTPSILSGFYLHGEGQVGMFHPLHQLLYRGLPLGPAFNIELLVNYLAAFAGMWWFMRRMAFDATDALFAAMLFAFSGFLVLHHHHLNLVAVVAHLPWLLAAADVVMSARTRRLAAAGFAALALILASEILLGFPQGLWFTLLALAAFVVFRAIDTRRAMPLILVACAIATGGLIGALQWLPTSDAIDQSVRPLLPAEFALTYSLHPVNVSQLWSPYLFSLRVFSRTDAPFLHEFGLYSGAFLVVAPCWLWIRRRDLGPRRRLVFAAITVTLVAFVLALGRYGGLYGLLAALPGFRWGRAPARYIVLVQFGLVLLAAIAFEDLRRVAGDRDARPWPALWVLWIPAGLGAITNLLLSSGWIHLFDAPLLAPLPYAALGSVTLVLITAAVTLAACGIRAALAALVILIAADLGWSGVHEIYRLAPRSIASLTAGMPRPSDTPEGGHLYIAGPSGNLLLLNGFRLSSGYVALTPATYLDPASTLALQLSGSHWEWFPLTGMQRIPRAVERARLLAQFDVKRSLRGQNAGRIQLDPRSLDLHDIAIVDRDLPPLAGPPGAARVVVDRPGNIVVETVAPGRQILALTERFHAGWHATADGQAIDTVRIHGDFLGAPIEAGAHRVEFRFRPDSFVDGVRLSELGGLAFGIGILAILYAPASLRH